jgi:O-antigen/teichoic acid export membrane protein
MVVLMWPGVFAMVAEFGLPTAYKFWAAKEVENVSQYFSNALVLTAVVGSISFTLAWFVIPLLIGERTPHVVKLAQVYAAIIPMVLLTDLSRGLLEGARRFQWVGAVRLIFFAVQLIAYVVLWLDGDLTLENAMYTMIAAQAVSLALVLFSVWYELRPRWQPRLSGFLTTIRYGMRDYPGVLTEFVNWRLDWIMLVAVAPSAAIGLYSVAVRLSDITTVLASSVGDALMPEVAATKKAEEATQIVTRSLRVTLCIHLLILVPLWIAAPYILHYAYGDGFVPVTNVLRLLMVASVVWSAGAIVISGLNGLGHPGLSAVARISAALVMVAALIAWLPTRGIVGAALSSITGYSVMFVVALFWLLRRGKVSLWQCLRPRLSDFPPVLSPSVLRVELSRFLGREPQNGTPTAEAAITGIE